MSVTEPSCDVQQPLSAGSRDYQGTDRSCSGRRERKTDLVLTDSDRVQVDRLRSVPFASASMSLPASAAQVFSVLERPGHLEPFHPFCQENTALAWDESERRDRIVYLNGKILDRQFVRWTPDEGFELLIGESIDERSLVTWSLHDDSAVSTTITITVQPYIYVGKARVANATLHALWIRPRLNAYLTSVVNGLNRYLETGERVARNAWGSHPWFSR